MRALIVLASFLVVGCASTHTSQAPVTGTRVYQTDDRGNILYHRDSLLVTPDRVYRVNDRGDIRWNKSGGIVVKPQQAQQQSTGPNRTIQVRNTPQSRK